MVPLAGLIDVQAERDRIEKELDKSNKDKQRIEGKLGNENFVAKAPEEVVAKERAKLDALIQQIATLHDQLTKLDTLV